MSTDQTEALRQRIRLKLAGSVPHDFPDGLRLAGVPPELAEQFRHLAPATPIPAAVLIPIIDYGDRLSILFTQRAADLRNHAGQVSFPGGRVEPQDLGPVHTALREAQEEIGLAAQYVEVVGYLPDHLMISGFRVTPVVGFVRPGFKLALDTSEVTEVFDVPVEFLFDSTHHRARRRVLGTREFDVYDIPWADRNIWGATAGMLMTFYRLLHD